MWKLFDFTAIFQLISSFHLFLLSSVKGLLTTVAHRVSKQVSQAPRTITFQTMKSALP